MITVTRLNGKEFVLNAELIRSVDCAPDTTITLINGDRVLVKEPPDVVVSRAVDYGRLLRGLLPKS